MISEIWSAHLPAMAASGRRRAAAAVWHLLGAVGLRRGALHQDGIVSVMCAREAFGCDLTEAYVIENSEYTT